MIQNNVWHSRKETSYFNCLKSNSDKVSILAGALFVALGFYMPSPGWTTCSFTIGPSLLLIGLAKMCTSNRARNDPENNIIRFHHEQIVQCRDWAQKRQWERIRSAHYDWWMFPINREGRGNMRGSCLATAETVEALKSNAIFMEEYREGVRLVCRAYGYDADSGDALTEHLPPLYTVRFGKMLSSLKWFGERELHQNIAAILTSSRMQLEDWILNDLRWETPLAWEIADSPSRLERQRSVEG